MGALAFLIASPAFPDSTSGSHILQSRFSSTVVGFDTVDKFATNDSNRVESLIDGGLNFQYAAIEPAGGASACNDPDEFFGQAEGYPDVTKPPLMVGGGTHASYTSESKGILADATTFTRLLTCPTVHEDGLTRTIYTLSADYGSVKIQRTFRFHAGLGIVSNTGLRAYIPRFIGIFHYVLVPNNEGQVVKYDANSCKSSPCAITDWNGTWFAEDDGDREGPIVIRDPSSTTPAFIGIQSGGLSNANFTSIVLKQPSTGWSGIVTETEYVCFYSANFWNQGVTLPPGCVPSKKSAATP
jgi:hypothetical protein